MNLFVKLGVRNVIRNPRRSALTILILSIGVASLMLSHGFILGFIATMRENATATFMGHAQAHHKDFQSKLEPELVIPNLTELIHTLSAVPEVAAYTQRLLAQAMISSSYHATGAQLFGVDFAQETKLSRLARSLSSGTYPKPSDGVKESHLLIGQGLAERLEVAIGDRIVVTISQAHTGELAQELFRVTGFVHFRTRSLDDNAVFISLNRARGLLGIGEQAHQLAIRFKQLSMASDPNLPVWQKLKDSPAKVQAWSELLPNLQSMFDMSHISLSIVGMILFFIILLSILNTMFMSIYQRMYEFGVVKALGTKPSQLRGQILSECLSLGLVGILVGTLLGALVCGYFSVHGIRLSQAEINGASLNEPVRTILSWEQFTLVPLSVLAMTLFSGLYPAHYAARITPLEGMRQYES